MVWNQIGPPLLGFGSVYGFAMTEAGVGATGRTRLLSNSILDIALYPQADSGARVLI